MTADPTPALVTVHVWQVPRRSVPAAVARVALDRYGLGRQPGCTFGKVLGTGSGRTFAVRDATLDRYVVLSCWAHTDDAARFEDSRFAARWRDLATGEYRLDLVPLSAHGRWSRREPFGRPEPARWDGPVAAVTRARLTARRAVTFWRSVPPVAADLREQAGLNAAVAFGEAPVGWQGTLSVWRDADALNAFAYQGAAHQKAVRRTRELGWYAEELFARFGVAKETGALPPR